MTAENTTNTALMVDRLKLNVDYKFVVRAYTSKGPGPWSNGLPFRTLGQCELAMFILSFWFSISSSVISFYHCIFKPIVLHAV